MRTPASQPYRRTSLPMRPVARSKLPGTGGADVPGSSRGGGVCSRAPAGSPSLSSSSVVTPKARARASSLSTSGVASPSSHLLTACRDTPTRAASSSWDSLAAFL